MIEGEITGSRLYGYFPRWSSLNQMGNSRILRSSYFWLFLVPLLAKILSQVGPNISISIFGASFILAVGLLALIIINLLVAFPIGLSIARCLKTPVATNGFCD